MTGRLPLFNSKEKLRACLELADMVAEVGIDHIPCAQAPDLFFPELDGANASAQSSVRMAVNACKKACPLIKQCGTYALEYREEHGVWGGMSATDRKRILKVRDGKKSQIGISPSFRTFDREDTK
jgi:putative component of membrane protein insertase Oxa1/YidC/SpoIIIJ protein YidD